MARWREPHPRVAALLHQQLPHGRLFVAPRPQPVLEGVVARGPFAKELVHLRWKVLREVDERLSVLHHAHVLNVDERLGDAPCPDQLEIMYVAVSRLWGYMTELMRTQQDTRNLQSARTHLSVLPH